MADKIIVLGGDGFCGWPTSLGLADMGYEVTIVDNLSRRKIDIELEADSLTPIKPIGQRLAAWEETGGTPISFVNLDISTDYSELVALIQELEPKSVVHFAEQRAAPYSMKSPWHKRYTVNNNLNATHNLLAAVVESGVDTHVVHLGTMGVYGYATGIPIPEGYLRVTANDADGPKEFETLYPPSPGSVYHLTKTQDALFFAYYNRNDGVRITDLHQGIVWGTNTEQTLRHEDLINRFDYDGDYGTVLNRFLMQAAVGHPLTVHGTGGQTRAFIHIRDSVKCIILAIENPPEAGARVEIFNQVTETHTVKDLADLIAERTGAEIRYFRNPRNEAVENELNVTYEKFIDLGLEPITLEAGLLDEVVDVAKNYSHRCDESKIIARSLWRSDMEVDMVGSDSPVL